MKRNLLEITLELNITNFHNFFTVISMISKCKCMYMSGSELSWTYSQAFILLCLLCEGVSFRYHQNCENLTCSRWVKFYKLCLGEAQSG